MNTRLLAEKVFLAIFIFIFVIGVVWVPDTSAIAEEPEPQNQPPIAEAGGPYGALKGDPVTLNASASYDPDGESLFYEWDLNNDGSYNDATGVTVTTVFDPGQYTVGLRVRDPFGLTGEDTATIMVNPYFNVTPTMDQMGGSQWPPNTVVEVTVDNPSTGPGPDFSTTLSADEGGNIGYYFGDAIDLQAGFLVTVNGGGNLIKEHRIGNLTVTGGDAQTDIIHGTADPGARVDIVPWSDILRHEIADEHGNWTANYGALGDEPDEQNTLDLRPTTSGYITQFDEDGDFTQAYWRIPDLRITIYLADDYLSAGDWWPGAPIDVRVDDPSTPASADFSTTLYANEGGYIHYALGEDIDLQPGFVVTLDGGTSFIRELMIPDLAITNIDVEADIVYGVTDPESVVNLWGCADDCADRHVAADGNGNWAANFAIPGDEPDEQGTMDLRPDGYIFAGQNDEDGDSVVILRYIPNSTIRVHADREWIEGERWEPYIPVNLSIDDPATPMNPDITEIALPGTDEGSSDTRYFSINFDGFDIKAGFLVTASQGWVTKQHLVTDMAVTDLDPDEDLVSGTTSSYDTVRVDIFCPDYVVVDTQRNSEGVWTADFTGLCDLQRGSQLGVRQLDADGDSTIEYWHIPNPSFGVQASWGHVYGKDWWPNTTVEITIDNPVTGPSADFSTTVQSDRQGNFSYNEIWRTMTLQPGFIVTVNDGHITKEHVILNLPVTSADAVTDTVRGTASPGSVVTVSCWAIGCGPRHETVDAHGNWTANFAVPGDEADEQNTFDLQPGIDGGVSLADTDGDTTTVAWHVGKPIIWGVTASNNQINGREWPANASVEIRIDNPFTTQNPDYMTTRNTDANGNFSFQAQYDILVGFTVSATDGSATKQVTVSNFEVTSIDWMVDTISGVGTPNASAAIWLPNWWEPFVVDATGHWHVDLAGKKDVRPEDQGFAIEQDSEGDGTQFNWQVPWFIAQTTGRQVMSYGWRAGSLVTLSVDDPDIPGSPDYTATQAPTLSWDLNQTQMTFDLRNAIALEPGTVVTLTDGIMTKTHTIMSLAVTGTDLEADTVFGTAAPGAAVTVGHLCVGNTCTWRHVAADGNGNWVADFSVPGAGSDEQGLFDIVPGTGSWVNQRDEDRDETSIYWNSPYIQASISRPGHKVEGYHWPLGSSITLTVDNPGNGAGTDYTDIQVAELDGRGGTLVGFEFGDFRLEIGAVITLTDGTTTRTHTVTYLDVTYIDADTDRVSGKAEPGSTVEVNFRTGGLYALRNVTADQAGNWIADFSTPGPGRDEQSLFDIHPGIWAGVSQYGDGRNRTQMHWQVPDYRVVAYPDWDIIAATDFWPGAPVTITVDDPGNGVGVDLTRSGVVSMEPGGQDCQTGWGYCFVLELGGEFNVQAGDLITITDGTHTVSHVVTPLAITDIDFAASTVAGVAEPLGEINLQLWPSCGERHLFADEEGRWLEDFSVPGDEDFEQETCDFGTDELRWISAYERSGEGETWTNKEVPNPRIDARFHQNEIHGYDWPLGSSVTLTIDDHDNGVGADFSDTLTVAEHSSEYPNSTLVRFELGDFELENGQKVTMSDGITTKMHVVAVPTITNVDTHEAIVEGLAAPFTEVWLYFNTWKDPRWAGDVTRHEIADATGHWLANFHLPGDEDFETQTTYIDEDHEGEVRVQDEDGDSTSTNWGRGLLMLELESDGSPQQHVYIRHWPARQPVTLTIDDPGTPQNPDYTDSQTMFWSDVDSHGESHLTIDWTGEIDVRPGFTITVTDGYIARSMIVPILAITGYDLTNDTISGRADPLTTVLVPISNADGSAEYAERSVVADINGNWLANFAVSNNPDEVIYDVRPGDGVEAQTGDTDGDGTVLRGWGIPFDIDSDGTPDILDPCPDDATDTCDQAGSAAGVVIGAEGGMLATVNGKVTLSVPAGSLENEVTLSITDMGSGYELASDQGPMLVVHSYSIQPHGTHFDPPASITFRWDDADNNGIVDGTTAQESDLRLIKDGLVIAPACSANPNCDTAANELTVHISDLSLFALAVPNEWTLKGFYQPVDMNGVYNIVKGGSTVPFKFEIFAGSTELIDTADVVSLTPVQVSCDTNAPTDQIETIVSGGTSLRYDAISGQFIYNWKTPKTADKCYRVNMTTMDGSSLVAYFKLR